MEKTEGGRGEDSIALERQNFVSLCQDGQSPEKKISSPCGACVCCVSYSVEGHTEKKSSPVARLANITKRQEESRLTPANGVSVL